MIFQFGHRFVFLLGWRQFLYTWETEIFRNYSIGCYSGIQVLKTYSMDFYSFCLKYSIGFTRLHKVTRSWFTRFLKKKWKLLDLSYSLLNFDIFIFSLGRDWKNTRLRLTRWIKDTRLNITRWRFLLDRNYSIWKILLGFGYSISKFFRNYLIWILGFSPE